MRVGIVGAGAMGGLFGGLLAEGGADVVFVDISKSLVARLRAHSLTLREIDGTERTIPAHATTDPAGEEPCDLVIVYVKSPATAAALELSRPLLGPETRIVSLQNGWGNGDRVVEATGSRRVAVGVTYHSAAMPAPGVVEHTATGPTYFGPWRNASAPAAAEARQMLADAGLEIHLDPDIGSRIWRKLTLNCAANPVAALTGLSSDGMLGEPAVMRLVDALARETIAVARAEGQSFDEAEAIEAVHAGLRWAGASRASMLQDVSARRPTEIDTITGAIVEAGRAHGVATPLSDAMYALVKGYEASLRREA